MATRPYSVRFLRTFTPGVWERYTVPAGYRAVVRAVVMVNHGGGSIMFMVNLAGALVARDLIPAANTSRYVDTRQVAYAGEVIEGYMDVGGGTLLCSGYLFDDPTGGAQAGQLPSAPELPDYTPRP